MLFDRHIYILPWVYAKGQGHLHSDYEYLEDGDRQGKCYCCYQIESTIVHSIGIFTLELCN